MGIESGTVAALVCTLSCLPNWARDLILYYIILKNKTWNIVVSGKCTQFSNEFVHLSPWYIPCIPTIWYTHPQYTHPLGIPAPWYTDPWYTHPPIPASLVYPLVYSTPGIPIYPLIYPSPEGTWNQAYPHPVGQTHACENITFRKLCLWVVKFTNEEKFPNF